MNFSHRSYKKELLDEAGIPFAAIQQNMQELNFINTWLGGHAITIKGFKKLLQHKKTVTVCEIGCGGGDNLLAVYKWCRKNGISVSLQGIDYNRDCISIARQRLAVTNAQFFVEDYKLVEFGHQPPDIIFSSLFCHHFTNEELVFMLGWMQRHAKKGFFINDLHRHFLAFYSIKILTALFSKSYLVKHDAPLSVQRGFIKTEWEELLAESAAVAYHIEWKWAFRWLITAHYAE